MLITLVLAAHAASAPPVWKWPAGEVQRFHIETEIGTPRGMRYLAANNLDARAGAVKLTLDTACTGRAEGKTQIVKCEFAYFDMAGKTWVADEAGKLDAILDEWAADIRASTIEMEIAPDGRVKTFDLKAAKEQSNRREGFVMEQQRVLLQRAFAAFDLPLTTDAKDWIRGWDQKTSSALMQLQTIGGTAGAFEIKHKHTGERDGLTVIESTGRATLSAGAAVDASTGGRLVDVRVAGESLFDSARGMLMWRDYTIDGRLTVSAQEAGRGQELFQMGAIQWVDTFPAPGEAPLSVAASRAPRLDGKAPPIPDGVALVPFADLGMQPLYVQGFPDAAKPLGLPPVKVKARVVVSADGLPTSIAAYEGFEALGAATQAALEGARFPAKGSPYAVDLDVEWRPE